MRWAEALHPVRMQRVALLTHRDTLRAMLVGIADEGTVDLNGDQADGGDRPGRAPVEQSRDEAPTSAAARLARLRTGTLRPALSAQPPDLDQLERAGRVDLIAGEAEWQRQAAHVVSHGDIDALLGWIPLSALPQLAARIAPSGSAAVALPRPAGVDPPTQLSPRPAAREFAPLVQTYGTVSYADLDPSLLAGLSYLLMFGMMFADVGHGALLAAGGLACRFLPWRRLRPLRRVWVFITGAGLTSMAAGVLYGEFFGPTGVIAPLAVAPLEQPVALLLAAVAVGAFLLAGAYVIGTVNRVREGGWRRAAYDPSGLAGTTVFAGLGLAVGAFYLHLLWVTIAGAALIAVGLAAAGIGLFAAAGGGASGATQAAVELFDMTIRLGSNLVSFARLAAFGLTHAALGGVIWSATSAMWGHGAVRTAGAVVVFTVGNALAFALEALIAGVQALRLEYYELFSRVFDVEGRPYRPWHVPLARTEEPCRPG